MRTARSWSSIDGRRGRPWPGSGARAIDAFLPLLDERVGEGMVTLEKVRIVAYRHGGQRRLRRE
jgi:hypothetical protein